MPSLPFSMQLLWGTALGCRLTAASQGVALCDTRVGAESSFTDVEKCSGDLR